MKKKKGQSRAERVRMRFEKLSIPELEEVKAPADGEKSHKKLLPPCAVNFICKELGIDKDKMNFP